MRIFHPQLFFGSALIIFFLPPSLAKSPQKIMTEYPAANGLYSVLMDSHSDVLVPTALIYEHEITAPVDTPKIRIPITSPAQLVTSVNNHFVGIFDFDELPDTPTEPQEYCFRVYDHRLQRRYRLSERFLPQGKYPRAFVSDKYGSAILSSPNGNQLQFYNQTGQHLRTKALGPNRLHHYEAPLGQFNRTSSRFYYYSRQFVEEEEHFYPLIYMFSLLGEELWQNRIVPQRADILYLSPDAGYIAISGPVKRPLENQPDRQTVLMDSSGKVIVSFPFQAFKVEFDPTERLMLTADEYRLRCIDLHNFGALWNIRLGEGRTRILDVRFLSDTSFAIVTGTEIFIEDHKAYDRPALRIYSTDGELRLYHQFPKDYTHTGQMLCSQNRDQVGIALHDRYMIFHISKNP